MKLIISGIPDNREKEMRDRVEKIIRLLRFKTLLNKQKELHILFKSDLSETTWGECMIPVLKNLKETRDTHVIHIRKTLNKKNTTKTLIHELTHLRQILSGKFAWVQRQKGGPVYAYWKKENLGNDVELDSIHEDLPWEREAILMEETLWNRV